MTPPILVPPPDAPVPDPRDRFIEYVRALLTTHPGDLPRAAVQAALTDLEN